MKTVCCILLLTLISVLAAGQPGTVRTYAGDESVFYAQTKQVNQFFRRFNGEEDVTGKRLYNTDASYHDVKLRKKYLNILFDLSSPLIPDATKEVFILEVTSKKLPVYLDFHSGAWFAEVNAEFTYKKESCPILLYFKLEQERQGYKWALSNVYFNRFERYFNHVGDSVSGENFLHPMSHELDFMNLHKMFSNTGNLGYYVEKEFHPDHLSIFLKELQEGNLKFVSTSTVKFHFFQIPNWYFELTYFNRNINNSGWLISNLVRVNDQEKKNLIRNYTHEK